MGEVHQLVLPALGLDGRPTADEVATVPYEHIRLVEALIFAASEPVEERMLAERLPDDADLVGVLRILQATYASRGVNLRKVGSAWAFRTAPDLALLLGGEVAEPRKLSRAALETLAVIAYHQPVTRPEIEEIRGVSISSGTLETLLETGWIRLRGRRKTPGRPVTYGTTQAFLDHFGLESVADLPGLEELKAAGLLDARVPLDGAALGPRPDAADEELFEAEPPAPVLDLLTPLSPEEE